jgi:predicted nucleic acid-binding protein
MALPPKAFAIASQFRIGVYDRLYIVLAEQEGRELRAADDRLVSALQARFACITPLASLP